MSDFDLARAEVRHRAADCRQMHALRALLASGMPCEDDLASRLHHCSLGRIAAKAGDDEEEERRAKTAVCRILRSSWMYTDRIITAFDRYGIEAVEADWAGLILSPDRRVFGHVYIARSGMYPDLVKIGFSRDPGKRAKSLGRHIGASVDMLGWCRGTQLVELAIHECLCSEAVRGLGEWYPAKSVPEFLWRHICLPQEIAA